MEILNKSGYQPRLLGQVALLMLCWWAGERLTAVYGAGLARALNIDFLLGRTAIVIFFAAIVGIGGAVVVRGVRGLVLRLRRLQSM